MFFDSEVFLEMSLSYQHDFQVFPVVRLSSWETLAAMSLASLEFDPCPFSFVSHVPTGATLTLVSPSAAWTFYSRWKLPESCPTTPTAIACTLWVAAVHIARGELPVLPVPFFTSLWLIHIILCNLENALDNLISMRRRTFIYQIDGCFPGNILARQRSLLGSNQHGNVIRIPI
jgi:hypothetical protein